jgi:hypothetical protein
MPVGQIVVPVHAEGKHPRLTAGALLLTSFAFAAAVFFAWWTVARDDREMRADLLQQARHVAQAVSIEHIQALSGTEADISSPVYHRLKALLAAGRSANPQSR